MAEVVALKGITDTEVAGIPVGGVAVGLLASGFVDGVMGILEGVTGRKLPVWAVKGLGAYAANRWLPRYIGKDGAKFATAILAVDGIQSVYDFRALTSGLFQKAAASEEAEEAIGRGEMGIVEQYEVSAPELRLLGREVGELGRTERVPEEEVIVSVT